MTKRARNNLILEERRLKQHLTLILLILYLLAPASLKAEAKIETPEIMVFWDSPSESAALHIILEELKKKGILLSKSIFPNSVELNDALTKRLMLGYPPTLFQWHGGDDLFNLANNGLVNIIDIKNIEGTDAVLNFVKEKVTIKGGWVAIPVGIHICNWIWFNADIYKSLNLKTPNNIEELIEQCQIIKQANYIPIALGNQPWQRTLIFTSILTNTVDQEQLRDFIMNNTIDFIYSPEFMKSIALLKKVFSYASTDKKIKEWEKATELVKTKQAAIFFMGDWARAELKGQQFTGMIASGSKNTTIATIDVLAFAKDEKPQAQALQMILAQIIISSKIQKQFNMAKGSLPIRNDIDLSDFDQYSQHAYSLFSKDKNLIPDTSLLEDRLAGKVITLCSKLVWENNNITEQEIYENIKKQILIPIDILEHRPQDP